jgi:hypothetical protein
MIGDINDLFRKSLGLMVCRTAPRPEIRSRVQVAIAVQARVPIRSPGFTPRPEGLGCLFGTPFGVSITITVYGPLYGP